MKLKDLFKNLLLLFLTLFIFFILLELAVRIFYPEGERTFQFREEIGVFTRIPNLEFKNQIKEFGLLTHKVNSQGFVDLEYKIEKDENLYRILILGDSWVEAIQVPLDKTFHKILEVKLNESESGKKFEVISLGVSGLDTSEEYLILKEFGIRYNPDLVILALFAGNDIFCNLLSLSNEQTKAYFDLENGNLKQIQHAKAPNSNKIVVFINRYFRSPRFLYKKIKLAKYKWDSFKSKIDSDESKSIVDALKPWNVYKKDYDNEWNKARKITLAIIEEIKSVSRERGANFVLMNIPHPVELDPELWDKVLDEYPSAKNFEWDLEKLNQILKEFSKEKNIYYLDLFSIFREHISRTGEEIYEDHFNSSGHRLTADLIYKFLIENNLIKIES